MKSVMAVVVAGLMVAQAQAAVRTMPVSRQLSILDDAGTRIENSTSFQAFRVEVIGDSGTKVERFTEGRTTIPAVKNERYFIRLHNPLPVRVAVNLSIDGLNSLTGKPSGIVDGMKWMIDPHSFIDIRGWQVNGQQSRRFFFTEKRASYAAWEGKQTKLDLAQNCGVIGAAFFWNQEELNQYDRSTPIDRRTHAAWMEESRRASSYGAGAGTSNQLGALSDRDAVAPSAGRFFDAEKREAKAKDAGTGMGERESHPTQLVEFTATAGMYSPDQAVLIYYQFEKPVRPNPFPGLSYAPEMPCPY